MGTEAQTYQSRVRVFCWFDNGSIRHFKDVKITELDRYLSQLRALQSHNAALHVAIGGMEVNLTPKAASARHS